MEQMAISWEPVRRIYTVSLITQAIRDVLDAQFSDVWVAGEVSGVKRASSGHIYFTLKDEQAQIQCACWRSAARLLRFLPQDGIAVLARGRIDVYPQRGQYQMIVETLEPQGYGARQLAFERLKKKLEAEGLFAAERKRLLPQFPRRIGIVTSPTGAAIRDMIQILTRRWPGIHVRLYPALVQGDGAAEALVAGLRYFGESGWPDVVIVGRGGGSLEDLWAFNEEPVARAVAACPIPVISAVGHESDFTITDFVADLRAPTPSAAAEIAVPEQREVLERVETLRRKSGQAMRYRLAQARNELHQRGTDRAVSLLRRRVGQSQQRVDDFDFRLREVLRTRISRERRRWQELTDRLRRKDLRLQFADFRRRLDLLEGRLGDRVRERLVLARTRLDPLSAGLRQMSPLAVLGRGYAIVQDSNGRVVRDAAQTGVGSPLRVRLHKGRLQVVVREADGGSAGQPE